MYGASQGVYLVSDGYTEGSHGDPGIQAVSLSQEEAYWDNHFWAKGYCVDIVVLDAEIIRKYVKHQQARERYQEQQPVKHD